MRGRNAMTIRLIASDLDGTLYHDDKTISERTKNTLAEAAQRKICFVPVTGRSILGVDRLIRELPWIRYVITGNGARIYDLASNTVIHEELLPAAQVIKMQELSLTLPVACACYIGDQGYISRYDYDRLDAYLPDKNLLKDVRRLHEPVEDLAETLREKQQGVLKFQVYFSDANLRKPVTDAFLKAFPDISAASTLEYNVEITSKNADKGNALRVLCDHLHMPLSAAIAFGDGVNDMTLLSQAGIGVAMRNSMAEVFSAADAVTDTNNHDGVASYIEQHLL